MSQKKRVCIIGAGPSGLSALYHFDKLKKEGTEIPEVVCFERQSSYGGLWNYSWRTGIDEYGEPAHGSMYRYLWSNGPKEVLEYPDYTFDQHFGKPIPSFPTREVLYDYLKGRSSKSEIQSSIRFSHKVHDVQYNAASDDFTVVVKNLEEDSFLPAQKFDYVIVANGHFSTPHVPTFPGIDRFPGRVLHSHDFRDAIEFKDKRILVIGASLSAEDIALQCVKYGCSNVIITWRTKPLAFKWPAKITERPLLTKIDGKTVHFKDGSQAEVDVIILCTGYLFSFPFLGDSLRLKCANVLYPKGLYNNIIWTNDGNNKLLYMGMVNQYYSYIYFDVQARWIARYITGHIKLESKVAMEEKTNKWIARLETSVKDADDEIDFQGDLVNQLAKESNYGYDLDIREILHTWVKHKTQDIATYRDHSFSSKHSGSKSPVHHSTFMDELDDSMESYLGSKN